MSTYVREKVLRVPMEHVDIHYIAQKYEDDFALYLEKEFPNIFNYATVGMFQIAPTEKPFFDYVLDYEYNADGEYGKTRALTDNEKRKYLPVFQKIDPSINMDWVRLVDFCWYNGTEAPSYYDHMNDPFYDEV